MKGRQVVLGQVFGRPAAALIVDGRLEDLVIDPPDSAPPAPGAIFRAIVDRPMKGLGGVFLRLPAGARGFLRQASGLTAGRAVLVQVSGHAEDGKAVPVTTRLLFKGRHAIVTPGAPGRNLSRAIRDEALRATLETLADQAMAGLPDDLGLILRSAAGGAEAAETREEIAQLATLAQAILADTEGPAELLLDAPDSRRQAWCEWAEPAPDVFEEGDAAFAEHGVDAMIEALRDPVVGLGHEATMVVEPTRALIAVDVNTGGDTSPAAALKANVAAARELPRQLRLRGLGGQVVVDFAPMPKRDRAALDQVLRAAFRRDGSEASLAGWTVLGNYEIQRKRDRIPLARSLGWRPG